jgi:hypothetical protein
MSISVSVTADVEEVAERTSGKSKRVERRMKKEVVCVG